MSETILIVLGAVGLLAAGGALGFWLAHVRTRGETARADEVREQFDDYRREVTQHFGRTAEHFKAIGREYRELYEHMASGADSLCDREAVDVKLSFAPKAILESIAEDQPPQAPRDFEQADQPADQSPVSPEATAVAERERETELEAEPAAEPEAKPESEPAEAMNSDAEAESGDAAPRTLH
jgi:uncharacterized membrane-anchored protein YhcB (DUF1043 family)